jgi:hypothetical protein
VGDKAEVVMASEALIVTEKLAEAVCVPSETCAVKVTGPPVIGVEPDRRPLVEKLRPRPARSAESEAPVRDQVYVPKPPVAASCCE